MKNKQRYHWAYLLSLFLAITNSNKAIANFAGEWVWAGSNTIFNMAKFTTQQDDSTISGSNQTQCGSSTIMGGSNETKIGMELNFNTKKQICPSWIVINASCDHGNCSIIKGTWYDSNHLMGNLTWIKEDKKFYISFPKANSIFVIDKQLNMPSLSFTASNLYPPAPLKWTLKIDYHWRRGSTSATLPTAITHSNEYTPDFSSWNIIGGNLTTTVTYDPSNSNEKTATANYKFYGTNPGKLLIESEIKDSIQSKIACVESGYRQFDADREGGQGLPLIGLNEKKEKIGGIGIMQVINETITPGAVWNWRANIENGLQRLNDKREKARRLYINERIRLNADRKKLGLLSCPSGIPYPLTEEQITRDSIRRYNYGVEYRWEPRDGKNCAGQWTISPSCVRHPLNGCDKDYVNKVLQCTI